MTGEDLGYKPRVVEQAKFEYYLLGNAFNKGLNENNKNRRTQKVKRLKNIEGKNEEQSETIKN